MVFLNPLARGCECILLVCIGLLAVQHNGECATRTAPANVRAAVEDAISQMRPALVRIQVISKDYREGREIKSQSVGSGAIISKDGYIVTNHHVAGHAARIICTLWNREEVEAELVGTDVLTDLAVIKLKLAKPLKFSAATFGDSSTLTVGDWVLAMGSPMALSQSVTLGIVSNTEMIMPRFFGPAGQMELDGENVGSLVKWIGHDAAIYGGNSGGPLTNLKGEIIGINEISFGLSGAIPGNLARKVVDELIASGKVQRSWTGMDVQPLFKHSGAEEGIIISGVVPGSPAEAAGLKEGDLLLELSGKPTNVRFNEQMPDFMQLVTTLPIRKEVHGKLLRSGQEVRFNLTPVERGELNPPQQELKDWGITASDISFLKAKELQRTNQLGVLVTSVRPGGPAGDAKPAMRNEDVLREVDGQSISNLAGLTALTRKLMDGKKGEVRVVAAFEREAQRYLTVLSLGLQDLRDPGLEVAKAWLPLETQVISREIARHMGMPELRGFYVTRIYPRTSAETAGLQPGDFIVGVDGEKLTASGPEHAEELSALIRQYEIGTKVQLSVLRSGQALNPTLELQRSPRLKREMKKYRNEEFEFTARDISFFDVAEERWLPSQTGVRVEEVRPGSWAEIGAMLVDDLIVQVDGQPIENVGSLRRVMEEISKDKRPYVVVKVIRGVHSSFLELEPTWAR